MARKAAIPQLSDVQKNILIAVAKCRDSAQQLARRVRAVLLAAEGQNNKQIARQVHLSQGTVRTWRNRWNRQQEKIDAVQADGNENALREFICEVVLADDPYNGKRGKYTPEQVAQLYAIACTNPQDSGRPISHWSCRELADAVFAEIRVKRKIVESMPISTVWDFFRFSAVERVRAD